MTRIEQGDIITVRGGRVPFLVVSSDFYNQSGLAVVCPIVSEAAPDALHVAVESDQVKGVVLCEQLAVLSYVERGFSERGRLKGTLLPEIIYRVQSIFD